VLLPNNFSNDIPCIAVFPNLHSVIHIPYHVGVSPREHANLKPSGSKV